MSKDTLSIQLIGYGNMGKTIVAALESYITVHEATDISLTISDRKDITEAIQDFSFAQQGVNPHAHVVILGVKPQQLYEVDLSVYNEEATLVSILAGVSVDTLSSREPFQTIVRCMPNLLMSIGKGNTGRYQKGESTGADIIKDVFAHVGKVTTYARESQLDDHAALFGSGPAYLPMFMELLVAASETLDLDISSEEKKLHVVEMFAATLEYMKQHNIDTKEFMQRVMSKGGTTQAFRETFQTKGGKVLLEQALQANKGRSEELNV